LLNPKNKTSSQPSAQNQPNQAKVGNHKNKKKMKIRKTKGVGSHHSLYPTSSPWVIMGYAMAKKKKKNTRKIEIPTQAAPSQGENFQ